MDQKFGNSGIIADALGSPRPALPGPVPTVPPEPTVGEFIRDNIAHLQAQIKHLELQHHEARTLGLLDVKVGKVRDIVGW